MSWAPQHGGLCASTHQNLLVSTETLIRLSLTQHSGVPAPRSREAPSLIWLPPGNGGQGIQASTGRAEQPPAARPGQPAGQPAVTSACGSAGGHGRSVTSCSSLPTSLCGRPLLSSQVLAQVLMSPGRPTPAHVIPSHNHNPQRWHTPYVPSLFFFFPLPCHFQIHCVLYVFI